MGENRPLSETRNTYPVSFHLTERVKRISIGPRDVACQFPESEDEDKTQRKHEKSKQN
jgi:hypothetical protein